MIFATHLGVISIKTLKFCSSTRSKIEALCRLAKIVPKLARLQILHLLLATRILSYLDKRFCQNII